MDLYEHYQHINKQLREAVLAKQPAEHLRFKRATIKKNMPQRLASVAEVPEYTTELDTIIEIIEFPGLRCQLNDRNVELLSRSRLFWVLSHAVSAED